MVIATTQTGTAAVNARVPQRELYFKIRILVRMRRRSGETNAHKHVAVVVQVLVCSRRHKAQDGPPAHKMVNKGLRSDICYNFS